MSKKPKHAAPPKPQPAQIAAIRTLLANQQFDQARRKLAPLLREFPEHRPLFALAWELAWQQGDARAACIHAYDWVQLAPASLEAHEALASAAFEAALPALGAVSGLALQRLRGEPVAVIPAFDNPLGPMSAAEMALNDAARLLLGEGRYAQVAQGLQDAVHPSLRNNRGIALFASARPDEALECFAQSWAQAPQNTFALERIIRLRLWRDGRAGVGELAAALHASRPLRPEDALGKLWGLLLLGDWEAAEACWQADGAGELLAQDELLFSLFAYAGAVAALASGQPASAAERLHLARRANPDHPAIAQLQEDIAAGGADYARVELGEAGAWFPSAWIKRLRELARAAGGARQLREHAFTCAAHADYLGLAAELGGDDAGDIAMMLLQQRASGGDAAARDQLVSLLTRQCGRQRNRIRLLYWLIGEHLIDGAAPVNLLREGGIVAATPITVRLTLEDSRAAPFPPGLNRRMEQIAAALQDDEIGAALALAEEACRHFPNEPHSHIQLGWIREAMGEHGAQVEASYRRALELDDDSLIARAGLARLLAERGEAGAARSLLEPVLGRAQYDLTQWSIVLLAQRAIAAADGDEAARAQADVHLLDLSALKGER